MNCFTGSNKEINMNIGKIWICLADELVVDLDVEMIEKFEQFEEFFIWPAQHLHLCDEQITKVKTIRFFFCLFFASFVFLYSVFFFDLVICFLAILKIFLSVFIVFFSFCFGFLGCLFLYFCFEFFNLVDFSCMYVCFFFFFYGVFVLPCFLFCCFCYFFLFWSILFPVYQFLEVMALAFQKTC